MATGEFLYVCCCKRVLSNIYEYIPEHFFPLEVTNPVQIYRKFIRMSGSAKEQSSHCTYCSEAVSKDTWHRKKGLKNPVSLVLE